MKLLQRIRSEIDRRLGRNRVIQFSPARSGSTLVFNILLELFPDWQIIKTHTIKPNATRNQKVVITYRHPMDCVASSILRYHDAPTEELAGIHADRVIHAGLRDLAAIIKQPHLLLLRYEDFYDDFNVIFNALETYFRIDIPESRRQEFRRDLEVDRVREQIESDDGAFGNFDERTHWHSGHISSYKGRPGYYREFFTEAQREVLHQKLGSYIDLLGYDA